VTNFNNWQMAYADQRLGRLERALAEEERRREGTDPRTIIQKLQANLTIMMAYLNPLAFC
jgi:hypothetical protein